MSKEYELGVIGGQIGGGGKAMALPAADVQAFLAGLPPPSLTLEAFLTRYIAPDTNLNSVYTVPKGKKFVATDSVCIIANPTAGPLTYSAYTRTAIGDVRLNARPLNSSVGAGAVSTLTSVPCAVLEAGESIGFQASGAGLIFVLPGFLMPDTVPIKTHWLALNTTYQTLYECPSDRVGIVLQGGNQPFTRSTGFAIWTPNDTGGARVMGTRYVPAGATPSAIHQLGSGSIPNANTALGGAGLAPNAIGPGERLLVTSDSAAAGQHARVTILEIESKYAVVR